MYEGFYINFANSEEDELNEGEMDQVVIFHVSPSISTCALPDKWLWE